MQIMNHSHEQPQPHNPGQSPIDPSVIAPIAQEAQTRKQSISARIRNMLGRTSASTTVKREHPSDPITDQNYPEDSTEASMYDWGEPEDTMEMPVAKKPLYRDQVQDVYQDTGLPYPENSNMIFQSAEEQSDDEPDMATNDVIIEPEHTTTKNKIPASHRLQRRIQERASNTSQEALRQRFDEATCTLVKYLSPNETNKQDGDNAGDSLRASIKPHEQSFSVPVRALASFDKNLDLQGRDTVGISASRIENRNRYTNSPEQWISIDVYFGNSGPNGQLLNSKQDQSYSMSWRSPSMKEFTESEIDRMESLVGLLTGKSERLLDDIYKNLNVTVEQNVAPRGIDQYLMAMIQQQAQSNALLEELVRKQK